MNEPLILFFLLALLIVPAVLVARSMRRVGREARRAERLLYWAAPRGWQLRGSAPELVGRWQCPPFTAPERYVDAGLVGEFHGREATSLRLETPPRVFHVFTLELRAALPVVQVMTDGVPDPDVGEAGAAWLRERAPEGLSLRVERGVVVGWLPGEPLLTELDRFLEVLLAVAERVEALER